LTGEMSPRIPQVCNDAYNLNPVLRENILASEYFKTLAVSCALFTNAHTYARTYACAHIHMHAHTHIAYSCTHIHTHTHAPAHTHAHTGDLDVRGSCR
jgi:hypothetical protein